MGLERAEPTMEADVADKVNISSKLQTIDYSHGSLTNVKSVDYKHGTFAAPPAPPHDYRETAYPPQYEAPAYGRHPPYPHPYEGYPYRPGGGGYPPGPTGNFLPPGIDAATLFAAYASQTGTFHVQCPHVILVKYTVCVSM